MRWGDEIVREDVGGLPLLMYRERRRNLTELLLDARRWHQRDHLVQGARRLTFGDVERLSRAAASLLGHRGVRPGDRLLLLGANSPDWVIAFWGVLLARGVVVLGNAWWSAEEVAHAVGAVKPAIALGDPRFLDCVPETVPRLSLQALVAASASVPNEEGHDPGDLGEGENAPAAILFTSGTSGPAKGAILSHRALIALQHALLHVTGRLPHQIRDDGTSEVLLQTGPLFHIGGVQALHRSVLVGGTLVFLEGRFEPRDVLDLIEQERVTRWGGPPTMVSRLLSEPSVASRDLSSLRSITLGGTAVPPELVRRAQLAFPNASRGVSQIYGLSEAGGTLTSASGGDMAERPSTAGRPLPVAELRIAEPGPDGVGEILARSATQMSGYWGDEASAIDDQGWLHTGDLGRLDEDGYLYVTGRSKDVIIRGGENVAASHVEAKLLEHRDVVDVAVLGLPDEDLGEVVAAAVVLTTESTLAAESLDAFARERLAYFEVPSRWWLSPRPLPVNATGKADKRALRDQWPATPVPAATTQRSGT